MTLRTIDIVRRTGDVAKAILDGEKIVVARPKNENWVIMSETVYNEMVDRQNAEFIAKLDRGQEDIKNGRLITKTMEELRAMEEIL